MIAGVSTPAPCSSFQGASVPTGIDQCERGKQVSVKPAVSRKQSIRLKLGVRRNEEIEENPGPSSALLSPASPDTPGVEVSCPGKRFHTNVVGSEKLVTIGLRTEVNAKFRVNE